MTNTKVTAGTTEVSATTANTLLIKDEDGKWATSTTFTDTNTNFVPVSTIGKSSNDAFEFFSTITQVLLYSGIVGGSLFALHIYNLWKEKNIMVKGLLIMALSIWFSSQMLFANSHIMYIALIVAAVLYIPKKDMKLLS